MKPTIRPATLEDLDTLLQFEQGVIIAERPFDPTLQDDFIKYYDTKELITASHIELLVAEFDGQIIGSGYARIEPASKPYYKHKQHGYLGFMFVDPNFRGKRVNQLIIDGLKKWCKSQDISELRLEVYADNAGAIKAYGRTGFKQHMIEMRMSIEK